MNVQFTLENFYIVPQRLGNGIFFLNQLYVLTAHTVVEQMRIQMVLRVEQEGGGIQERPA